jgi:hypothetical protein
VAGCDPRLHRQLGWNRRRPLQAHRKHFDPVPDALVDRAVEGLAVVDVTDGVDPFRSMEACEDRFGYLRSTRFEVFGQQDVTLDNPLRPAIR